MPKPVQVKRQQVYDAFKNAKKPLSSEDIAKPLKVSEYAVRGAINWLKLGGYLKDDGYFIRRTKPNKRGWCLKYKVKRYSLTNLPFDNETCGVSTRGIHCEGDRERELNKTKYNADLKFLDSVLFGRMKAKS